LQGAGIFFSGLSGGMQTDSTGKFSARLPKGRYTVTIRSLGYKVETFNVDLIQMFQNLYSFLLVWVNWQR